MSNETLNPSKVELADADMPKPDYSQVYGINLGFNFIMTETFDIWWNKRWKADGYGIAWYSSKDDGKVCCKGQFDGKFDSENHMIAMKTVLKQVI